MVRFYHRLCQLGLGLDFRDQDSELGIVYGVFACKTQKTPTLL